jgi:ERCC4-type nuclease
MYKLQIDYREKAFIQSLQKKLGVQDITELETKGYSSVTLSVGDFVITNTDQQDQPFLFIERKTKSDLISSIIDGRFREQRARLQETGCDVAYIIELNGNSSRPITPQLQNVYVSSITNLIFKHNIKVFLVKDVSETAELIITLLKKHNNGDFVESTKKTENPVKIKSKGDHIKENLFAHQLTLINGVSLPIANKISERYKTPMELITAYTLLTDVKEKCALLKEIQVTEKRKIGPAISKRIYESMCGNESGTEPEQ